ncbi:phosphatase PAP2 family protein [Cytophagaceae bacterium AH-315-L13]|nr:phosphatase PAP2 family protein [Cytophagaceae bacterium AH-315-L13]
MFDSILELDYQLFFLINGAWTNSFFDWILPLFRNKYFWFPLYLFLIVFFIVNYKKRGLVVILFMLLAVALSDQISSSIVKPIFQRIRPCNEESISDLVRNLVRCGSGYSFTSSHAANHFSIAVFLIMLFFRKYKWLLPLGICWAASISYAQIYVGVHYPLDILAGAFMGSVIGLLTGWFSVKVFFPFHVINYSQY